MRKLICLLLSISVGLVLSATLVKCPEGTGKCERKVVETTSFEFLSKLSEKDFRTIVSLTISNASIEKVDPKMKYLKNLEYLDLSHNNVKLSTIPSLPNLKTLKLNNNFLKNINLTLLPQNVEDLDISNNELAHIPSDWQTLKSLKTLHLFKNPIDCECFHFNVIIYNDQLRDKIAIPEPVTCYAPKQFLDKNIAAVNCSRDDIMQYDEPMAEGSGTEDIFKDNTDFANFDHLNEEDPQDGNTIVDDKITGEDDDKNAYMVSSSSDTNVETNETEGSGDEGSGFAPIIIDNPVACHENCVTPKSVGADDEANASPLPNLFKQISIIGDDVINGLKGEESETSTTTTTTTTLPPEVEASEAPIIKESETKLLRESDKSEPDAEVFNNNTQTSETKSAFVINQNSSAVYIVIGICVLLSVVFIVCLIKKRKDKRNRRRGDIPTAYGEEMKPLSKQPLEIINEKPANNIPEHIPLMNGQNGKKHSDDTPILKSFIPLVHPEIIEEENPNDTGDVEVREKPVSELMTPPRERVTVRASELPDSIPKTPVLVQRQKNSDGEIVTTVLPP